MTNETFAGRNGLSTFYILNILLIVYGEVCVNSFDT